MRAVALIALTSCFFLPCWFGPIGACAAGQTATPSSSNSQSAQPQSGSSAESQNRIHVLTEEVLVPVTVTDQHGELATDLVQKDFRIFDNGFEQDIIRCELGGEPIAVVLVIETSSHIDKLVPTMSSMLYDAMGAAVRLLSAQPDGRHRVMLVVGESQDSSSTLKLRDVIRDASLNNISIYAIGPSSALADLRSGVRTGTFNLSLPNSVPPVSTSDPPRDPLGRPRFDVGTPLLWLFERGSNAITNIRFERAIQATGGYHYRAFRDRTILTALDRIAAELHLRYIISYRPSPDRPLIGLHEIRVEVSRPGLTVRARPGYFVESQEVPNTLPTNK
jgi:hypothetical protein